MTDETEENTDETESTRAEEMESDEVKSERLKRGVSLGALVVGIYTLDRLLGEEKVVTLKDNRQIKVRKGFLDDFFSDE